MISLSRECAGTNGAANASDIYAIPIWTFALKRTRPGGGLLGT